MEDKLMLVEEEVLSLVGQIEFGDITDLSIYWKSLRDALMKLDICDKSQETNTVSDILNNLPESYRDSSLIDIAKEMEEKTALSSSDSVLENELSELRDLSIDFEEKFMDLIERISTNEDSE